MRRIAVFASGRGSNFEAIVAACERGEIPARVVLLVCDRPGAPVVELAERHGVPAFVFAPKSYPGKADYEREIAARLAEAGAELICLAGYMRIVSPVLLEGWRGRMLNLHPSLLPAFKGAHAIRDAFEYGVKVYGATVHRVDDSLDGGPIVAQRAVEYAGGDLDELEAKIHAIEHTLYPEAICSELKRIESDEKKNEI